MWRRPDVVIESPANCPLNQAQARLILNQHGANCPTTLLRNRYVVHGLDWESARLRVLPDSDHDRLNDIYLYVSEFHRPTTRREVLRWSAKLAQALGWNAVVGRTGEPLSPTGEVLPLSFRGRLVFQMMHFGLLVYTGLATVSAVVAHHAVQAFGDLPKSGLTPTPAWTTFVAVASALLTCAALAAAIALFRAREHWHPESR